MTEHRFLSRLKSAEPVKRVGRVQRILPTYIEADGPNVPRGALCRIEVLGERRSGERGAEVKPMLAEVVSVNPGSIILVPFEDDARTFAGAVVEACDEADLAPVGDALLGRAVDPLGRPIDGRGAIRSDRFVPLTRPATAPLDRVRPKRVFETGIRAMDAFLTLGEGQRVGIFAASGVGKTSLMTQLATQARADRYVVCLIGERGREVETLWSETLSEDARQKTVLVAATSDQTAAMRVRAGDYALALAETWCEQGHHVLLLLDSVTRLAMAMRETGLAAGEPPTLRAYTPSVFAAIPRLVERCGARKSGGAITGIMTVLSETDDIDDPISEMLKSLLDGHVLLSRTLAERGHFPAIDVVRSISRMSRDLMTDQHRADAQKAVAWLSTYEGSRTLIESGVYVAGANAEIDRAIERRPAVMTYLKQSSSEHVPLARSTSALKSLIEGHG
jgi:flagellum-specific ATP synthase